MKRLAVARVRNPQFDGIAGIMASLNHHQATSHLRSPK